MKISKKVLSLGVAGLILVPTAVSASSTSTPKGVYNTVSSYLNSKQVDLYKNTDTQLTDLNKKVSILGKQISKDKETYSAVVSNINKEYSTKLNTAKDIMNKAKTNTEKTIAQGQINLIQSQRDNKILTAQLKEQNDISVLTTNQEKIKTQIDQIQQDRLTSKSMFSQVANLIKPLLQMK